MKHAPEIAVAAKCAPERRLLENVRAAGLDAVEIYLSMEILKGADGAVRVCKEFPLPLFRRRVGAHGAGIRGDRDKGLRRKRIERFGAPQVHEEVRPRPVPRPRTLTDRVRGRIRGGLYGGYR